MSLPFNPNSISSSSSRETPLNSEANTHLGSRNASQAASPSVRSPRQMSPSQLMGQMNRNIKRSSPSPNSPLFEASHLGQKEQELLQSLAEANLCLDEIQKRLPFFTQENKDQILILIEELRGHLSYSHSKLSSLQPHSFINELAWKVYTETLYSLQFIEEHIHTVPTTPPHEAQVESRPLEPQASTQSISYLRAQILFLFIQRSRANALKSYDAFASTFGPEREPKAERYKESFTYFLKAEQDLQETKKELEDKRQLLLSTDFPSQEEHPSLKDLYLAFERTRLTQTTTLGDQWNPAKIPLQRPQELPNREPISNEAKPYKRETVEKTLEFFQRKKDEFQKLIKQEKDQKEFEPLIESLQSKGSSLKKLEEELSQKNETYFHRESLRLHRQKWEQWTVTSFQNYKALIKEIASPESTLSPQERRQKLQEAGQLLLQMLRGIHDEIQKWNWIPKQITPLMSVFNTRLIQEAQRISPSHGMNFFQPDSIQPALQLLIKKTDELQQLASQEEKEEQGLLLQTLQIKKEQLEKTNQAISEKGSLMLNPQEWEKWTATSFQNYKALIKEIASPESSLSPQQKRQKLQEAGQLLLQTIEGVLHEIEQHNWMPRIAWETPF